MRLIATGQLFSFQRHPLVGAHSLALLGATWPGIGLCGVCYPGVSMAGKQWPLLQTGPPHLPGGLVFDLFCIFADGPCRRLLSADSPADSPRVV